MGNNKSLIKLLAAGALVGAAIHLINKVEDKDKKKTTLTKAINKVGKLTKEHVKQVGKITKSGFMSIVDNVTAEYKDTADLSKTELNEMKSELSKSWNDVKDVFVVGSIKKPVSKKKK